MATRNAAFHARSWNEHVAIDSKGFANKLFSTKGRFQNGVRRFTYPLKYIFQRSFPTLALRRDVYIHWMSDGHCASVFIG